MPAGSVIDWSSPICSRVSLHARQSGTGRCQLPAEGCRQGLAKTGERELAYSTISEAVSWAETRGRVLDLIDLLRVKGRDPHIDVAGAHK
jgi:hypothetical protein